MKTILYNYDNLNKGDIDETVVRTKAIIINSKNEILLGYCNKTYQFPGGHLEENETLEECLIREVTEESGIELEKSSIKQILKIIWYNKNYHNTNINRENDINYFYVKTDKDINLRKTNFTENEKVGNYEIRKINFDNVEQVLIDSIPDNPINEAIVKEMLDAIKVLKSN